MSHRKQQHRASAPQVASQLTSLPLSQGGLQVHSETSDRWITCSRTTDFLLVGVLTLVVLVVVPSLVVLIICIKRKSRRSSEETDLRTRGNLSNGTNTEFPVYENTTPVPTNEESTYQTLDPASRDHNQIYSTLA
ncbi:hypothetical protein Q8A73_014547 [Channa argus]|nr:hypothetical protein Q8A73_014547 [Channa argus]